MENHLTPNSDFVLLKPDREKVTNLQEEINNIPLLLVLKKNNRR